MAKNNFNKSEANENLNNVKVLVGRSAGTNFLDRVKTKYPEQYEKYKNAKTQEEKKSYEACLKTEFKILNPLHDFIITNTLMPNKYSNGKKISLENYFKKIIDNRNLIKELAEQAIKNSIAEEGKKTKDTQLSEVEKLKKQLDDKDTEIKNLKNKNFLDYGANPEKEKLNAWLFSMGIKNREGVYRTQILTPKAMNRRMKLNRLAKNLNKITDPEKGVRYILNMTSFWKGGRMTAGLRRGIRGWIGYARKNPDKFGKQFKEKFNKFLPKPQDLKNKDEKQFAEYIVKKAEKFRDDFIQKQISRRETAGK